MAGPGVVEQLQDVFYRCKFSELLLRLRELELSVEGGLTHEMSMIKASALFEIHQVQEAKSVLRRLENDGEEFDENYLHAKARLQYMEGEAAEAAATWREMLSKTDSRRHRFKALLGIANCYYSKEEFHMIPPLIEQLCSFEPLDRDEDRISLMIFLGNYYLFSGMSSGLARKYFNKALAAAAKRTWNYFINRSMYGLASVSRQEGQHEELLWTLNVLSGFVDESESVCFSHFVNNEFKDYYSIDTPMEFDFDNKRIMIKNRWLLFHDKPMLFNFLELLHTQKKFVTKEEIAEVLWPHEAYKPKVHDPRIFDIAKRARSLIESYENQPVVLLSGRSGYKLASA